MNLALFFKRHPIVLPLACAAAVAMVVVSESAYWSSSGTLTRLGSTAGASIAVQGLMQDLADGGSVQKVQARLEFLDTHYGRRGETAAVLDKLHTLTAARLARRADPRPADDGDRLQMAAIGDLAGELLGYEARTAATGRLELQRTLIASRVGIAALSGFSLLALFLYLRQSAALKAQQFALKQAIQAERDRLDNEVRHRTVDLTELTRHLHTAREDERHRLARNLHDELGALLTSAKLDAARIRSRLAGKPGEPAVPEALERLAHLVQTLNQSIALGRSIVEDLRPSTLSNLGLLPTLEILAREFGERSGVVVECDLAPVQLDAAAELMVYRLVQEAITNISKHAQARRVWLHLAPRAGWVELSVRDDGVGFQGGTAPGSAHGLVGMRFRVEAEGGTLTVAGAPGQGTTVHARLPASGVAEFEGLAAD